VFIHSLRRRDQNPLSNKRTAAGCSYSSTVRSVVKPLRHLTHDGHPFRGGLLPSLSPREGVRARDYFSFQSGRVTMSRWPHGCHNSRAGEPAPAYCGYNRFSTGSRRHRRCVASGAPAAQQPASVRRVALSGRVVASRRRPARRHRHQHATPKKAAPAISVVVTCSISGARAIRGASTPSATKCAPIDVASHTDGELHDDGPQGGNQPPLWWGRQQHRHRERCRDIEGRNLEKDFDLHAPVHGDLVAHAPLPPNSSGVSGGGVHGACPTPAYDGLAT
jgi:hypothetical protein